VRRHAKAPFAGSTSGTGNSRDHFRRVVDTRGVSRGPDGSGAASARTHLSVAAVVLALLVLLTFAVVGVPVSSAAECPNEATREAQGVARGAVYLPDCMAYEQVTPPQKENLATVLPEISANGNRVLFRTLAALGDTPGIYNSLGDFYLSNRGSAGWGDITPLAPPVEFINQASARGPTLAPNLESWLWVASPTQKASELSQRQVFQGGLDGSWKARSPLLTAPGLVPSAFRLPQAVSADLSWVFVTPESKSGTYLTGDPSPEGPSAAPNVYAFGPNSTEPMLLARDSAGEVWGGQCGAWVGGSAASAGSSSHPPYGTLGQGAVSAHGSRVFFTTRPGQPQSGPCEPITHKLRLMQRLETPSGPQITELVSSECTRTSPPCSTADGNDFYQGASLEGNRIYFTTTRQLTNPDKDTGTECSKTIGSSQGCDLYLLDTSKPAGKQLTQVSAGDSSDPTPGEGANVLGSPLAISGDGSRAYFVAQGVLTHEPREGLSGRCLAELSEAERGAEETTQELGKCRPKRGALNLYAWDAGTNRTAFIGDLDSTCAEEIGPRGKSQGEITDCKTLFAAEGSYLDNAMAVPMLGGNPEDLSVGGNGHILAFKSSAPFIANDHDGHYSDVFRYDADNEGLRLVSKAAPRGSETPADNVSTQTNGGVTPPLPDFAEYERWVSEDGNTIAFGTEEPLTPGDTDGLENPFLWQLKEGEETLTQLPAVGSPYSIQVTPANPHGFKSSNLLPTVSLDGNEVAFPSSQSLVPADRDTAEDIYVARFDGGFPSEQSPDAPCSGEACLGFPAAAPPGLASSSSTLASRGNVERKRHHSKSKHRRRRARDRRRGHAAKHGTRADHRHRSAR
jgi:hypothetical protein